MQTKHDHSAIFNLRLGLTRRRFMGGLAALGALGLVPTLALTPVGVARAASPTFVFAVVPQFPAIDIHRAWQPLLDRLSAETGLAFELKIFRTIPDFEAGFLTQQPDFIYCNPMHMMMAEPKGYRPLVHDQEPLSGILVVHKDSPVRRPEDLDGQPIAFPAPNAFGASLYMRAILTREFKIAFKAEYVKTHSNVYRQVRAGLAAAGGGIRATLAAEPPEIADQLRIIYETPKAAPHPVAAHRRVPIEAANAVGASILKLGADPKLADVFRAVYMPRPISAEWERDYLPLRRLGLDDFVVRE